jgi:hypothetical protein
MENTMVVATAMILIATVTQLLWGQYALSLAGLPPVVARHHDECPRFITRDMHPTTGH